MSTETEKKHTPTEEKPKQGFFSRFFTRIDSAMKAKAESKGSSCCGGGKSGDKCC